MNCMSAGGSPFIPNLMTPNQNRHFSLVENEEIKVGKKSGRTRLGRDTTIHELIDELDCPTFMFHDGNRGAVRSGVTNGLSASQHDGPERRLRKRGQGQQESIPAVLDQLSSDTGD
jgi:hypothetical protein